MVARLKSPRRVVFFDEIQLVALLISDADGAQQFLHQTLGDSSMLPPRFGGPSWLSSRRTAA